MKLQPKKVIAMQVASQRKSQIDEGIALAQKVDLLRRTLGDLEAQHEKFISGMKDELDRQTKDGIENVAQLKAEIGELEERRRVLLEPVDEEWAKVKKESEKIIALSKEATELHRSAMDSENRASEKLDKSSEKFEKIKVRELELGRVYERASVALSEADEIKQGAVLAREVHDEIVRHRDEELTKREARIIFGEQANQNRAKLLNQKEIDLNEKERAITDGYATLLRTQERIKNG